MAQSVDGGLRTRGWGWNARAVGAEGLVEAGPLPTVSDTGPIRVTPTLALHVIPPSITSLHHAPKSTRQQLDVWERERRVFCEGIPYGISTFVLPW